MSFSICISTDNPFLSSIVQLSCLVCDHKLLFFFFFLVGGVINWSLYAVLLCVSSLSIGSRALCLPLTATLLALILSLQLWSQDSQLFVTLKTALFISTLGINNWSWNFILKSLCSVLFFQAMPSSWDILTLIMDPKLLHLYIHSLIVALK